MSSLAFNRILRALAGVFAWGAILFLAAGRLHWTRAWSYLALYTGCLVITEVVVSAKNIAILKERSKRHVNTQKFDKFILPLIVLTFFVFPLVAGLDAGRFGWSHIGWGAFVAALPIYLLGCLLVAWTMIVNPYLEMSVRIQQERGHRVVNCGPYGMVRHPMYAGVILQSLAVPLMLGSLWSYVPVAATVSLFAIRTALEDLVLRKGLPGYEEYSKHTRYRLIPGLW